MSYELKKFMPLQMNGLPIKNFVVDQLSADPTSADLKEARLWYNTTSHALKFFDGTSVKILATGGDVENAITMASAPTAAGHLILSSAEGSRAFQEFVPSGDGFLKVAKGGGGVVVDTTTYVEDGTATTATFASGVIVTSVSDSSTDEEIPTALAVNSAIENALTSIGKFVSDFDASSGELPTTGSGAEGAIVKGDYWRVSVAGSITGLSPVEKLEVGDLLVAKADEASTAAQFFGLQGNVSDCVTNSNTAVSGNIAIFDGTTGRVIKDGGVAIDSDGNINLPEGAEFRINGVAHNHTFADLADNINGTLISALENKAEQGTVALTSSVPSESDPTTTGVWYDSSSSHIPEGLDIDSTEYACLINKISDPDLKVSDYINQVEVYQNIVDGDGNHLGDELVDVAVVNLYDENGVDDETWLVSSVKIDGQARLVGWVDYSASEEDDESEG